MIIGHKKQWDILSKKLERNCLSHAYLFVGPEQVGKKKFAKEFAKLINCKGSCKDNECTECKLIEQNQHPDVLCVLPKDQELAISQVRAVQNFLNLKPYYSTFKIVILDNAHLMNQEAQNCFLKTLEEPKGNTILILVTSKPEMLLPTILSRCQQVKFFNVGQGELRKYLDSQSAKLLPETFDGKPGRMMSILEDKELFNKEKELINKIAKLCGADLAEKFTYIKSLPEENYSQNIFLLKKYLRMVLFSKVGAAEFAGQDYFLEPAQKLKLMPASKIKQAIELIESIDYKILTTNVNQKLALEIIFSEI